MVTHKKEKMLTEELPEKWQSQKSSRTKDRIVIATLECIVEFGYEHSTMAKITDYAKVSPGAMQYHFGSKIEAIKAAITYLNEKRLIDRQHDGATAPKGNERVTYMTEKYWEHLNDDYFIAYQELVLAARTHADLASVLKPAYQKFVTSYRDYTLGEIPEWNGDREAFERITDVIQYILEGLAFGRLNNQIDDVRARRVVDFAGKLMVDMLDEIKPKTPESED